MRFALTAFVTTMLLLGSAAAADSPSPSTPAAPATQPDTADPVICVKTEAPTGSHIGGSKECHTRSGWDQIRGATGDAARRYLELNDQQRLQLQPPGGAGGH
jgi:hypothetical protein